MIILTHIGNNIPSYVEDCFRQIRASSNYGPILFMKNKNAEGLPPSVFKKYGIHEIPVEPFHTKEIDEYTNSTDFNANIEYGSGEYWSVTQARLFYLYEFTKRENINEYFL